jgi:hypothetical protein
VRSQLNARVVRRSQILVTMKVTLGWIIVAVAALAGCEKVRAFPPLHGITRVQARTNTDSLGTIVDSLRVAAVVAFVNARQGNWKQPWAGVPVSTLGVTFFAGREVRGSFSAGSDFFECQREGDWFSRDATASEIVEWRALLAAYGAAMSR